MAEFNRYGRTLTSDEVAQDAHRKMVGGMWEEIGRLQLEFMISAAGLAPDDRLLDIGCGCLRGGVHFIRYLEPGNYYGLDSNASLIEAGLDVEVPRHELQGRVNRDQLVVADDFGAWRFGASFDLALAVSVWTHLPLNHVQRSLYETARVLKPGGSLYATLFLCAEDRLFESICHQPGGIVTHRDRDPFHHAWADIVHLCKPLGLDVELIGEWNHPRAQQMVRVTRPGPLEAAGGRPFRRGTTTRSPEPVQVVSVIGMHRSGTSALAGSLQAGGLYAGEVVEEAPYNRRGNRENLEIRALNDAVLETSGGAWDRPPAELVWTDEQSRRRDELIAQFSEVSAVWTFKDPRSLLTWEFWRQAPVELLPVGTFRHPTRVVRSLAARSPISPVRALRLWIRYNRILLTLHRSESFGLVCFDTAPDDFQVQLKTLVDLLRTALGGRIELSADAASSFFTPELIQASAADPESFLTEAEQADQLKSLLTQAERIYAALRGRSLTAVEP